MSEKTSIPTDPTTVCVEGIMAKWSVHHHAYVLAERLDGEDQWRSMGLIWNERDARNIVEGWVS